MVLRFVHLNFLWFEVVIQENNGERIATHHSTESILRRVPTWEVLSKEYWTKSNEVTGTHSCWYGQVDPSLDRSNYFLLFIDDDLVEKI